MNAPAKESPAPVGSVSLDTGYADAYGTVPTFNGLWLRVRGRYTN